jgi:hypothetical protein
VAGRVEDTINLLGHAARSIVRIVSKITEREPEEICRSAGIPLLLAPSIKAGLDIDWSAKKQKAMAIEVVHSSVSRSPWRWRIAIPHCLASVATLSCRRGTAWRTYQFE